MSIGLLRILAYRRLPALRQTLDDGASAVVQPMFSTT
jgi:hypothetical protein